VKRRGFLLPLASFGVLASVALAAAATPDRFVERSNPGAVPETLALCLAAAAAPEYYEFPLVRTKRVAGTGAAVGRATVAFARSPFGVAIAPDGSYVYDVSVSASGLPASTGGEYVVWIAPSTLDEVVQVGALDESLQIQGRATWNKFLVFITLEAEYDPASLEWRGPVVLRGMSRSGLMHTIAGHGPFQPENCAAFGFVG